MLSEIRDVSMQFQDLQGGVLSGVILEDAPCDCVAQKKNKGSNGCSPAHVAPKCHLSTNVGARML